MAQSKRENRQALRRTFPVLLLIAVVVASLPLWPYSANWGYYPGAGFGLLLAVVLIYSLFVGFRGPRSL